MILILPIICLIITIVSFSVINKNKDSKPEPVFSVNAFLFFSIVAILPTIQLFITNGNIRGGGSELAVRGVEYFLLSLIGLIFGLVACLSKGTKKASFVKKFKIATLITYLPLVLFLLFLAFN